MRSISSKQLRTMSQEQREQRLDQLIRAAQQSPDDEYLATLSAQIEGFEQLYGIGSAELRLRVSAGTIEETDEVLEWLLLLKRRDLIASLSAQPR